MSKTGACGSNDHAHCAGTIRYGSGSWRCGCVCHEGQEPRPDGWDRERCDDCGHPRAFHGRRGGYADKCVGAYNQPLCPCLAFVEASDRATPKEQP